MRRNTPQTITVAEELLRRATMFLATQVQLPVSARRACLMMRLWSTVMKKLGSVLGSISSSFLCHSTYRHTQEKTFHSFNLAQMDGKRSVCSRIQLPFWADPKATARAEDVKVWQTLHGSMGQQESGLTYIYIYIFNCFSIVH